MSSVTHSQYVKRVKDRHGNKVVVLSTFTGICHNVKAQCEVCHTTFTQKADSLARYKTACACKHRKVQPNKVSPEDFKQRVEARLRVVVLGKYSGISKPVKVKSQICGHQYSLTFSTALWGSIEKNERCPDCRTTDLHYPLDWFLKKLRKVKSHFTLLNPDQYAGVTSKLKFHCSKCSIDFETTARQTLHTKHTCPSCAQAHTGYQRKIVKVGGKEFSLQGYEPLALELLVKKVGVKNVRAGRCVPRIHYYDARQERHRTYYPDFYVPKHKALIEVKSDYTLLGQEEWFQTLKLKRKASLKAGYCFSLVVFNGREQRLALPLDWHRMSFNALRARLL